MRLKHRLERLEISMLNSSANVPFTEEEYQAFEDWAINDPAAKGLLQQHDDYCMEKAYPRNDPDFYDELDDPVFWNMAAKTVAAFNDYLKARVH